MKKRSRATIVSVVLAVGILLTFLAWYRGDTEPLSQSEVDQYMRRILALDDPAARFFDPEKTRAFLAADDGKPFYVVNVFKLSGTSIGDDAQAESSGLAALNQFGRRAVPLWIEYGSHPIFASSMPSGYENEWDLVTVVRYRSRRDWIDVATSDEFLALLPLRFAAVKENLRMSVPGTQIPEPAFVLATLLGLCVLTVHLITRHFGKALG